MSHFTIGVIVPRTVEDVKAEIDRLLAPYSEHLDVEPYQRKCGCVGWKAELYGETRANELVGTWQSKRDLLRVVAAERGIDVFSDAYDTLWDELTKEFSQDWRRVKFEQARTHAEYQQPNAECRDCNGKGTYESTYNPASKWDWYRVGGRWDGALIENPRSTDNGFNWGDDHTQLQNNSVPVEELLGRKELFTFFALVTPDGEWHEKGRMGWFASVSDAMPPEAWETVCRNIYTRYREDHDIVLVDAHI